MQIGDRIKELYNNLEKTQKEFSTKVGISVATINSFISSHNPGYKNLKKIIDTYPMISIEWLINGTGSKFTNTHTTSINDAQEEYSKVLINDSGLQILIKNHALRISDLEKQILDLKNELNSLKRK